MNMRFFVSLNTCIIIELDICGRDFFWKIFHKIILLAFVFIYQIIYSGLHFVRCRTWNRVLVGTRAILYKK